MTTLSCKRRFHSFADEKDARDKAKEIAEALSRSEANVLTLRHSDRSAYERALDHLKPIGIPLEVATLHFSEAVKVLGSDMVLEACKDYARRNPRWLPSKTVKEVAEEMLVAKEKDGVTEIYLDQLRMAFDKFSEAFCCPIKNASSQEINEWLRTLKGSGRTWNNYRRSVGSLFKFAEGCGYVPKKHLDLSYVARAREAQTAIEIFTPEELKKLIAAAQINTINPPKGWNKRTASSQGLLPFLVLGAFAGLRTAEIERQLWSDIILVPGVWGGVPEILGRRIYPDPRFRHFKRRDPLDCSMLASGPNNFAVVDGRIVVVGLGGSLLQSDPLLSLEIRGNTLTVCRAGGIPVLIESNDNLRQWQTHMTIPSGNRAEIAIQLTRSSPSHFYRARTP